MNDADHQGLETRVLVLAATVKDGELTHTILARAGIACVGCADQVQIGAQLTAGAGAVLIAEEAIHSGDGGLAAWLGQQPAWSDLPVLVLARGGASSAAVAWAMEKFGNVTMLERPARVAVLVSAVRAALRARRRQYQLRDHLAQRERFTEQLNMAMAAAHAGSWQIDLTTGACSASDRALELHGLPPGTQLNHERALACVHPDDRASVEAALRLTVESGVPFRHQHRVPQPDGSVRWVSSHAERKGEGNLTCVVGLVQDVTEQKAADERLRASEQRFRLAADAVNGVVYEWDIQTGHVERQRGLYQVLGYHVAEVPPTAAWWRAQIHPDDLAVIEQQFMALTGNSLRSEYRLRHRDGRWLHVEDRGLLQRGDDGRVVRVVGCTVDVTERKRVEQALAERTTLLNGVLEGTPDVVFVKDLDGRILLANAACAALLSATPEQLVGMTGEELHPPDVAAAIRQHDKAVIAGGSPVQNEETIPVAGEARSFLTLRAPLRDGSNRVIGVLGIGRDITERQRSKALLAGQKRVLEMVATDAPLPDVLAAVCQMIEEQEPDLVCSLLLPDEQGRHIGLAVGASLRAACLRGLEGLPISPPYVSSCGQSLDSGTLVDAADVAADERFAPQWRALLLGQGLRACRSVPVTSTDGTVLASLGLYRRQPGGPEPVNQQLVDIAIHLTRVVLERHRAHRALRKSEKRLRRVFESNVTAMIHWDLERGLILDANAEFLRMTGYTAEDLANGSLNFRDMTPPEWTDQNEAGIHRLRTHGIASAYEKEYFRKDGSRVPVIIAGTRFEDSPSEGMSILLDITERKRVEQALAERTELLNAVLEGTTDVIFAKDLNSRLLLANAAFAAAARSTPGQLVGKTDEDWFPPDLAAAVRQQDEAVIAHGSPMQFEETIPVAGEARSFLTLKAPLRDRSSRVVGILGIGRDITERKRADADLRRSEARFRAAINAVSDIVWTNDALGQMAGEQAAWENFTGQDRKRYQGYGWSRAVHPDDAQPTIDAWNEAVAGKQLFVFEHRVRRRDGEWRLCSVRAVPVLDHRGEIGEWVGVHTDITERKRAEESLRESEVRLGGILRRSPAGILQTDAAGCMTLVNPRWCEMLGHSEAELLGRNILEITHPSSVAETAAAFSRLVAGGPDFQIEKAYCRKDGSAIRVQANVAAVQSPAGEFLGLIAVVLDISERLRTEEELRRLAAELSEGDRRKDVFLATLAHELRNPLAPILNGLQLMKLSESNDKALQQVCAMMDRQVLLLVRLVDDLLDLSRITQGKVALRSEKIDVQTVMAAAVESSRPAIEQAGHELTVVVPDEPIFVNGDAIRLGQVVTNLLNNSAKYTHRSGHIRLAAEREGGMAVISVKDNGIGIPPAMLGRVFDMFTQVDRTLEKTTGGLGIGLSLVKGLLELHGGTIEAKSDGEGMGSEFVVHLPVLVDTAAGPDSPTGRPGQVVPPALRRILVVDDNPDAADFLGQLLELLGNDVRTANDGEAGIAMAAQFRPELVLMDIGMPKLNGYEAARRVRQLPWGQGMVLVALTGWGQEADRKKTADAGFDHHLVKPVELGALTKLMSDLKWA